MSVVSGTDASAPERRPAAQRGALTIDRGAVEKIASQAAREVPDVGRATSGLVGLAGHGDLNQRPKASVQLRGNQASVSVVIGARYPTPLVDLTEQVRQRCADHVQTLTGLMVDRVDVTVAWLGRVEKVVRPQ